MYPDLIIRIHNCYKLNITHMHVHLDFACMVSLLEGLIIGGSGIVVILEISDKQILDFSAMLDSEQVVSDVIL
jgi:hypothetical protein